MLAVRSIIVFELVLPPMDHITSSLRLACLELLDGKRDLISGSKAVLEIFNSQIESAYVTQTDLIIFEKFIADLVGLRTPKDWNTSPNIPKTLKIELSSLCQLYEEGIFHSCQTILEKTES